MIQRSLSILKVQFRMFSVIMLLLSFAGESIASAYSYGGLTDTEQGADLRLSKKADADSLQWTFDLICDAEADDEACAFEGIRELTDDNFLFYCESLLSFLTLHRNISECSCRNYSLGLTNTETVSLVILHQSWKNFPG